MTSWGEIPKADFMALCVFILFYFQKDYCNVIESAALCGKLYAPPQTSMQQQQLMGHPANRINDNYQSMVSLFPSQQLTNDKRYSALGALCPQNLMLVSLGNKYINIYH